MSPFSRRAIVVATVGRTPQSFGLVHFVTINLGAYPLELEARVCILGTT